MMKNKLFYCAIALCLMAPAIPSRANINEVDTSRVADLDEVFVVAQPKEKLRLRMQPLSSSILDANAINSLGIRDIRELSRYVPSFFMPDYGSRYTSAAYIRGIGSRANDPAMGMYIDGVPLLSRCLFNAHLYETERVDILRGPQGTLYGMNTEGGLVRIYSKDPFNYQGTNINLSLGSHMYGNVEAAHYHKLNEKFAFSVAGFYGGQNGFFKNETTGNRADKSVEAGGKLRLLWKPTDRLSFDFLADYQWVDQNAFPYGLMDASTGKVENVATTIDGKYRRKMLNTGLKMKYDAKAFELYSTTSYQYLNDYMLMDIDYLSKPNMRMEESQLKNGLLEEIVFKGKTTGIWHWTAGAYGSYLWDKVDAPVYFDPGFSKTITDAAWLAQKGAMSLSGMVLTDDSHMTLNMSPVVPGLFHTPKYNLALFHESNIDITKHLTATLGLRYDYNHVKLDYETSGYMDIDLLMKMKRGPMVIPMANYNIRINDALAHTYKNDFNQLLPKVALTYSFDDGSNIYATWSKGYRSGGYNIQMFSDVISGEIEANERAQSDLDIQHDEAAYTDIEKVISYKPETSWNYELGMHLNLLPNLKVDLSGFFTQVHDLQLTIMAGDTSYGRMMKNVGKSNNGGIELSVSGSALDNHLTYNASYGFTHATFRNYTDTLEVKVGGQEVEVDGQKVMVRQKVEKQQADYSGNRVPYIPMHTLSLMTDYRIDINNSSLRSLTFGANLHAQGKTYWDEANKSSQKFYALLGLHAQADFGIASVNLWARNITNTHYTIFGLENVKGGNYIGQRGNPIQFGIDLRLKL